MAAGARRGPGSNQYEDKAPQPRTASPAGTGTLRAQARQAAEGPTDRPSGVDGVVHDRGADAVSLAQFAQFSRQLAQEAHGQGLRPPGFRSLPINDRRTLRRYPDGSAMVCIPARGRRPVEVVDDMVEGVIRANGLHGVEAARKRLALWESLEASGRLDARNGC